MLSIFYQNLGRGRPKLKHIYLSILSNNYDIIIYLYLYSFGYIIYLYIIHILL